MKWYTFGLPVLLLVALVLSLMLRPSQLRLPAIISDNMVLQQGVSLPIWGWTAPGDSVTVRIADQEKHTIAWADGSWRVTLDPLAAGTPLTMVISSGWNRRTIENILVGEVWLCAGQSNMDWRLEQSRDAAQDVPAVRNPKIRLFRTGYAASDHPLEDCQGHWVECTPEAAAKFSAVGYYFGRRIQQARGVPVGLIASAVGGTPAESWVGRETLTAEPRLARIAGKLTTALREFPKARAAYEADLAEFKRTNGVVSQQDETGWEAPSLNDAAWKTMELPHYWERANAGMEDVNGVVWFRREVTVPAEWAGKDLTLSLGPIDDSDRTYVNGEQVGSGDNWLTPRVYPVPGRLVQGGRLVIAVRVSDSVGQGGIWGESGLLFLARSDDPTAKLSLAGPWRLNIALRTRPEPQPPLGPGNSWLPTGLYNGMIAPLQPFALRGVIWYQGESNADRADQYRTLFPDLIRDWRAAWGQGNFPFLYVQLANFTPALQSPGDSDWAELREAQAQTLAVDNTAMAVAIDLGEADDIHPKDKASVGERLAKCALGKVYGESVVYSGPRYTGMTRGGGTIRLSFTNTAGGLVAKDGSLRQFAIAGTDRRFVWADAVIDGDSVVVSSPQVPKPVAVRYAWANNPAGCNLYNDAGLPASPFRTDNWPGITVGVE